MRNRARLTPGRIRAIVYAVLVHGAVIAALVVGFRWSGAPPAVVGGKPVEAVAVEDPRKQKLEEERRRAEEQRRREQEERKRQEAEAQKRHVAEQQRLEEERRKAEAEKQRQADLKRKQEEETRRKQEEQERRRKVAEEQLRQQLAAEEQARIEADRAARAASEAEKYRALIRQKVSRHWNRPAGASAGLRCTVRVRLVPGGEVLQATVVRGSGNPLFDRSVEAAVHKASPLPIPEDPDLFEYFREIEFLFNPEG